ncbi:hypothetical protein ES703_30017 [subsurface metagenome]
MRGHDRLHTRLDDLLKGIELDFFQAFPVSFYGRKNAVRILVRISMARKMLGCGNEPILLAASDEGDGQAADLGRIFSEGSCVDDRVVRIDIHIDHRSICHMDPQCSAFPGSDLAHEIGLVLRPCGSNPHKRGKQRGSCDLVPDTSFKIRGDQKRDFRQFLK